jgi:hypothetical protein
MTTSLIPKRQWRELVENAIVLMRSVHAAIRGKYRVIILQFSYLSFGWWRSLLLAKREGRLVSEGMREICGGLETP